MEVLRGAGRGRSALPEVAVEVPGAAVRAFGGVVSSEEAQLPDLHAGPQRHREGGHVGELEGDVSLEAGVDEAGRRVGQQAQATERALALEAGGDVIRQGDLLIGRGEHELPRMQHVRLVRVDGDLAGEVGLFAGGVDHRVLVVVEEPEEPVDAHVHGGGLDHLLVEGVQAHSPGIDLGPDVTIAQQHGAKTSLTTWPSAGPSHDPRGEQSSGDAARKVLPRPVMDPVRGAPGRRGMLICVRSSGTVLRD